MPAHVIYGAREFGFMAAEAPGREGLHVNPFNCIIEFLRADGSPAKPGEHGQIVVTDLLNKGMPLLNVIWALCT